MKLKSITPKGRLPVYDLSVEKVNHYIIDNGTVQHNTGGMYSADTVIILGRQQEKESTEIVGYNFIMNIEKSRFVREKKKIPLNVTFDGGINTYSGLLDIAMAIGWTTVPTKGWYSRAFLDVDTGEMVVEDKKWRRKETDCVEFWKPLMSNEHFRAAAHRAYAVAAKVNEFEDSDELFDY
ncbi:recombinase [Vibrio phage EniLVp02]